MKVYYSKLAAGAILVSLLGASATANSAVCFSLYRHLDVANSGSSRAAPVYFKDASMQEGGKWHDGKSVDAKAMVAGGDIYDNFGEVYTLAGSCDSKWKIKISCSSNSGYSQYTMDDTTTNQNVIVSAQCSNGTVSNVTWSSY